ISDVLDPAHPIALPDKPALEGLEVKWNARWEAEGTFRFDRNSTRERIYSIDTPPPTGTGLLPEGVGRQRVPDRARGDELLRGQVRSVAPVRCGIRAAREARQTAGVDLASELHRAVRPAHGRRREGIRGAMAASWPVGRLVVDLRDDWPPRAEGVADGVSASAEARSRLSARSADVVGHRLPHRGGASGARGSRSAWRLSSCPLRRGGRRF